MNWVQREEDRIADHNRRAVEDEKTQRAKAFAFSPRSPILYPPAPYPLCVMAFGPCSNHPPHEDHCLLCGEIILQSDLAELKNNLGGGFQPIEVGKRHAHIWCLEERAEMGCRGEHCHQGRLGNTCNTRMITATEQPLAQAV